MFFCFFAFVLSDSFNISDSFWSRDGNNAFSYEINNKYTTFTHTGPNDFSISNREHQNFTTGKIYKVSCKVSVQGDGDVSFCFVKYSLNGTVLSWSLALSEIKERSKAGEWFEHSYKFFITSNEPFYACLRIIGHKSITIAYQLAYVEVVDTFDGDSNIENPVLENDKLRVLINAFDLTLNVYDKISGRSYTQNSVYTKYSPIKLIRTSNSVQINLMHQTEFIKRSFYFQLVGSEVQINISMDNNFKMSNIEYPFSFNTKKDDCIIFPHGEGMIIPVNEENEFKKWFSTFSGHGICMAFAGVARYETKDDGSVAGREGYMAICQTNDDAQIMVDKEAKKYDGALRTFWFSQKGIWGYTRKCRLVFFADGGHVTMAKRYRAYSKEIGLHKTFFQKIEENPRLETGLKNMQGAANIWLYQNKVKIYSEMQDELDMKYILSSDAYGNEFIDWCNNRSIVSSRYDIYQDALDPAFKGNTSWHRDWIDVAFDRDQLVRNSDGKRRNGWGVYPKGSEEMVYCNCVSDEFWQGYLIDKVDKELKEGNNRTCRFIDVATAASWYEDYSTNHPENRSRSKFNRQRTLGTVGSRYGMVCGSETGHDAAVPFCDYFEGMMSLPSFRTKDSGRKTSTIVWEPEEHVVKYQVGHSYRIPLWELVYHDCLVAYWYWGDYNNKMPTLWDKRDLFNALYGVPPMYMFDAKMWEEEKGKFQRSYKRATPVAHLTMFYEMIRHKVLTKDWLVQQTLYANGVRATVNFGTQTFTMRDGYDLEGNSFRIEEGVPLDEHEESGMTPGAITACVLVPIILICAAGIAFYIYKQKNAKNESVVNEVINV